MGGPPQSHDTATDKRSATQSLGHECLPCEALFMTSQQLLSRVLQHSKIASRLTGKRTPEGDEIAWCIFHVDGKGKRPQDPDLRLRRRADVEALAATRQRAEGDGAAR